MSGQPTAHGLATAELAGRIALVTGATRGLGAAVAMALAQKGAHVIAVGRDVAALERLDDEIRAEHTDDPREPVTLVPMDLTDGPAIDRLGGAIAQRWGRLDILIANAALLRHLSPVPHIEPDLWDEVINVNLSANFRLIRATDALLRTAECGHAVFVTSGVTATTTPNTGAYAVSKTALEKLVAIYAREVGHTRLRINLFDPGVMRTLMRAAAFPGEDPARQASPRDVALELVSFICSPASDEKLKVHVGN